jgi:hypothetical protein
MPFVKINNLEIPVVAGGEMAPQEIGQMGRVYSGGYLRNRRALKRRWRFRTPLLSEAKAGALIGLLQGRGHLWEFDGTTTDPITAATSALTASSSGLVPSTLTGCTIHSNTAVDGNSVANIYTTPATADPAAARTQALGIYSTSENELPASQRIGDHSGADPFNALSGGVLSDETTKVFAESTDKHSLKVEAATTGKGAYSDTINVVASEVWTGSVYLLGDSGGESVTVRLFDNSGGSDTTETTVTLSATEWRRVWVTHTVDAGGTTIRIGVRSAAGATTFYADNWQMEEKAYPTAWVNGARASADRALYDVPFLGTADSFTFACWANCSSSHNSSDPGNAVICTISDGTVNNRFLATWVSGAAGQIAFSATKDGTIQDSGTTTDATHVYGKWGHFAMVYSQKDGTVKVYKDGVLVDTLSGITLDQSDLTKLDVGTTQAGASNLNGELDDVFLVPYAMDATAITALYNSGTAPTIGNHRLILSGDCVQDTNVTVVGKVNSTSYQPAHQTSWQENNRVIDFTLHEV